MPDTPEVRTENGGNVVQKAREDIRSEIQNSKTGTAEEQRRKTEELVAKLQQEIKDAETPAKEFTQAKLQGEHDKFRKEGEKALKTIIRAAEAAKAGIPISVKPEVQKLLVELADKSLSDSTASAIESNLKDYLLGNKDIVLSSVNQQKSEFEQAFDILRQTDPNAANLISESLANQAAQFNRTADQIRDKFAIKREDIEKSSEEALRTQETTESEYGFEGMWRSTYESYSLDKELVKALHNPSKFIEYVAKKKTDLDKPGISDEELSRQLSENIKGEIGELFAKVYHRLDIEKPKEFFEEITKQDFYTGIERVSLELKKRINAVRTYCIEHEDEVQKKLGGEFQFLKDAEEQSTPKVIKTGEKDSEGNDMTKIKMQLVPLIGSKKVSLGEFMRYMDTVIENYIEFRAYAHNARAIFLHPADPDKGFYSQLAGYAEKMQMINFDEMLLLPDADIFLRAFTMYDKYLDEQFAFQDWNHTPTMFTPERGELLTKLELEILEQLKNEYRDENGKATKSEDRLRSAIAMAVGISRGVFLNEVEKAAFAEPGLDEKGNPTFKSYYTMDNSALNAFNPVLHLPYRFQTEGAGLNPIYFLPVEGLKMGIGGTWDHKELWKKMQAFRESFLKGRKTIGEEQLFIDFCTNVGQIGGPFKRKGWRTGSWFPELFIYDKKVNTVIDYLNTWKNLENVGFEALNYLVNGNLNNEDYKSQPGFLYDKKMYPQRLDLFKYLYKTYFDTDPAQLEKYLGEIRNREARSVVLKKIAAGKIAPSDIEEGVEIETSKIFLNRALARVVAQRFPTKFFRIDRDRFEKDGVSHWKKVQKLMDLSNDPNKFDLTVKDFLLAEDLLRKETSQIMKKQIAETKKRVEMLEKKTVLTAQENEELTRLRGIAKGSALFDLQDIKYRLSEEKIKTLLKGKFIKDGVEDKERLDSVISLYKVLNQNYISNSEFLDTFAENIIRPDGIKQDKFKFTLGIEELDMSFVPFRGAGPRLLARAVGDISSIELNVSKVIIQFPELLKKVSIDGKGDFSEIVGLIDKAKHSLNGAIGSDYAAQVAHHLAALAINYFKKDTIAKPLFGIFGMGRTNSLAGEIAGRSTAVWEWDAREIDRFIIALESADILKRKPFLYVTSNSTTVPRYVKIPFTNKLIKVGLKRRPEIGFTSSDLRREFGADAVHIAFEMFNLIFPAVLLFLLWQYIQKASKEGEKK